MAEIINQLLPILGRTTLALALATIAVAALLRIVRPASPTVHRAGWVLTLLVGWSFLRLPVFIPWHEPAISDLQPVVAISDVDEITVIDQPEASLPPSPEVEESLASNISEPVAKSFNWPLILFSVWILGMALLVLNWLVGYFYFVLRLPQGQQANPDRESQWLALLSAHGVRRSIPLRVTARYGPMLCRLPRGYEVVVPVDLWQELNSNQREAILRHELAHYQRGDVWKSLAARVLALPHWFNPASWYAVRSFDESAEWACDLAAASNQSSTAYAEALLKLGTPVSFFAPYTSSARGRSLAKRIRHLLTDPPEKDSTMKKILLTAAAISLATVALVRVELVAKESPTASKEKSTTQFSKIAKKDLRYDGQDFATWVRVLRTDLSPERRTKAVQALSSFAAHGYGREAASEIIAAIEGDLNWVNTLDSDMQAEYKFREVAGKAVALMELADTTPLLLETLKSDDLGKRMFALKLFSQGNLGKNVISALYSLMQDNDPEIRETALRALSVNVRDEPEFRSQLLKALKDKDLAVVSTAIWILVPYSGNNDLEIGWPRPTELEVKQAIPTLISLVNTQLSQVAISALGRLGPAAADAIPTLEEVLEKALKAKNSITADVARKALEKIRPDKSEPTSDKQGSNGRVGGKVINVALESPTAKDKFEVTHDDGKSAGKRSIAGSGHAIRAEAPDDDWTLTSVRIYGSRYGYPKPPQEDFLVWLCDENLKKIAEFDFPYSKFKRADPEWVTLNVKPTKVPKKFVICAGFNPQQTKGVYVHYDAQSSGNSLTGLPDQPGQEFSQGDWMIRATLERRKPAE